MSIAISVIIPYYQGKRYLPDLRSMMERNAEIFRKETGKEIEVLLVNDSPWEKIEPELKPWGNSSVPYRLKVLTNSQNSGIHATRVNGLNAAEGEFVQFLDQDDRITDFCLLSQYNSIGNADFVMPVLLQQSDSLTRPGPDPKIFDTGVLDRTDYEE